MENGRNWLAGTVAMLVLFASHICCGGKGPTDWKGGQLHISDTMSPSGTVASRTFKDEQGRITREIRYGLDASKTGGHTPWKGPYKEEWLKPTEVRLTKYDEQGRIDRTEIYTPAMTLRRIIEYQYGFEGERHRVVIRRPDGRRQHEVRWWADGGSTQVPVDASGEKYVGIGGRIPPDVTLPWGDEVDGLSCAIVPVQSRGALKDIRINVTVSNCTSHTKRVLTASRYRILKMELRDADGKLVPQDTEYIKKRDAEMTRMNAVVRVERHGDSVTTRAATNPWLKEHLQTLKPMYARSWASPYSLKEWYTDLKPGKYSLIVRRRAVGNEFSLVSNAIVIEIEPNGPESKREP